MGNIVKTTRCYFCGQMVQFLQTEKDKLRRMLIC